MKSKKCYIETSVWNQLLHIDRPDWKDITEVFFKNYKNNNISLYISEVSDIPYRIIKADWLLITKKGCPAPGSLLWV